MMFSSVPDLVSEEVIQTQPSRDESFGSENEEQVKPSHFSRFQEESLRWRTVADTQGFYIYHGRPTLS